MRVRFFQANDEGETAGYLAMQRRVREFWSQFSQVQATPAQRWAGELRAHLRALDEAGIAMMSHIVEHYVANARVFARSLKKIG